jgi:DNA-binding transcriptional regulator YhcF (GntR family)
VSAFINVKINRDVNIVLHNFIDYFQGFENVEAVRELFGDKTEKTLNELKVEFVSRRGYMGVNEQDGHLIVSAYYLKSGTNRDIYLDIIHELVHVRQYMEGKKLFDNDYDYVERPTEIEAYKHAVKEARRLGMTEKEILSYLRTEWLNEKEFAILVKAVM